MDKPEDVVNEFPFILKPTGSADPQEIERAVAELEEEFELKATEDNGEYVFWRKEW